MGNRPGTFNSETASEAGKKSRRGKSIRGIISDIMEMKAEEFSSLIEEGEIPKEWGKKSAEEVIWLKATIDALNGDKDARRDISDRKEGKPVAKQEISGPDGSAIETKAITYKVVDTDTDTSK